MYPTKVATTVRSYKKMLLAYTEVSSTEFVLDIALL